MKKSTSGFTIVELLIVIVVIAILATISVVAFNGVQMRARDAKRASDIATIAKALEAYYAVNGRYPAGLCTGSCVVNGAWSTTNDASNSWDNLKNALVPNYISSLPSETDPPIGTNPQLGRGYGYFSNTLSPLYCNVSGAGQMYILVYTLESGPQKNTLNGDCTSNGVGPYANRSNYRVVVGGS